MNDAFSRLSSKDLRLIANSLRSGRLTVPATPLQIGRIFQGDVGTAIATKLSDLSAIGFSAEQVAVLIDSVLQDRELFRHADHPAGIDLVTSGPEAPGINAWLARKLVEHFKKMAETGQFRRAI